MHDKASYQLVPVAHKLGSLQAEQEAEDQEAGEIVEATPEPTDEELLAQLGLQLEQQIADLTGTMLRQGMCSN